MVGVLYHVGNKALAWDWVSIKTNFSLIKPFHHATVHECSNKTKNLNFSKQNNQNTDHASSIVMNNTKVNSQNFKNQNFSTHTLIPTLYSS